MKPTTIFCMFRLSGPGMCMSTRATHFVVRFEFKMMSCTFEREIFGLFVHIYTCTLDRTTSVSVIRNTVAINVTFLLQKTKIPYVSCTFGLSGLNSTSRVWIILFVGNSSGKFGLFVYRYMVAYNGFSENAAE